MLRVERLQEIACQFETIIEVNEVRNEIVHRLRPLLFLGERHLGQATLHFTCKRLLLHRLRRMIEQVGLLISNNDIC